MSDTELHDEVELPEAPVCWLWWAAEPESVRRELGERLQAEQAQLVGAASGSANPNRLWSVKRR